eukprot:13046046-Alexandrium_andersonii.AAC.1
MEAGDSPDRIPRAVEPSLPTVLTSTQERCHAVIRPCGFRLPEERVWRELAGGPPGLVRAVALRAGRRAAR